MISRNAPKLQAVTRSHASGESVRRAEAVAAQGAGMVLWRGVARPTPAAGQATAARRRGLSLVELLIALAISAALLTATMVAIDASFKAYAAAAESASVQTATRMVVHRVLTLLRTSYAVGPAGPADDATVDYTSNPYVSPYIELVDSEGRLVRLEYDADTQTLQASFDGGAMTPLLTGVVRCGPQATPGFMLQRSQNPRTGVWEVVRGSIDIEVQPDQDTTLAIESDSRTPVRAVASTMPRKLR